MLESELINAFRYHRRKGVIAREAFGRACIDVGASRDRLADEGRSYGWQGGTTSERGLRHFPDLQSAGLRMVGYADEIARLDHTGWFVTESEQETARGVVVALPARKGRPVYMAGYEDAFGNGYVLDVRHLFRGDVGGAGEYSSRPDDARDAARMADEIARIEAEDDRDYDRAWQAGSRWAELGEEVKAERKEALAILAERRTVKGVEAPALCKAIRAQVEAILSRIEEAREERAKLENEAWGRYLVPFNDGAGLPQVAGASW